MAKLHQVVKDGQICLLKLAIEEVSLDHVCRRVPLLLLPHQLTFLHLARHAVRFSTITDTYHDAFLGPALGVCPWLNHIALFESVGDREAGWETQLFVLHRKDFIGDHKHSRLDRLAWIHRHLDEWLIEV